MKTAMQELIEWMDKNSGHCSYGTIRGKATELLEKEKQQIIDAHIAGQKFATNNDNPDSEEYYNQTYNPL